MMYHLKFRFGFGAAGSELGFNRDRTFDNRRGGQLLVRDSISFYRHFFGQSLSPAFDASNLILLSQPCLKSRSIAGDRRR